MSLLFNKVERENPADPNVPEVWYLLLKNMKIVRGKEVAERHFHSQQIKRSKPKIRNQRVGTNLN
jgi:hypothetical protein